MDKLIVDDGFIVLNYHEITGPTYGFDLDGTLTTLITKDPHGDYVVAGDVINKLNKIVPNHNIVIFTNQKGISMNKITLEHVIRKINEIKKYIAIDPIVCISTRDDKYRKPFPTMYNWVKSKFDINVVMFVGDACGRNRDFSDSDRKFALNCDIEFTSNDVFFGRVHVLAESERYTLSGFNPAVYLASIDPGRKTALAPPLRVPEMIIMIGPPGSGKSSLARNFAVTMATNEYIIVNQDTLKTKYKCYSAAAKCLKEGKSVIIDNTNPGKDVRGEYIKLAIAYKYYVRCFYINTIEEICKHLARCRTLDNNRVMIPDVVYNRYRKLFELPGLAEGFNEIVYVDFIPDFNLTDKKNFLYLQ